MRVLLLLVLMLASATPAAAKTLQFDLGEGPGVRLVDVDVEEAGTIHDGGPSGPTFETGPGEKTFRAIITADILVYDQDRETRRAYYDRFQYLSSDQNNYGTFHAYRIRDVVRFPIKVVNGGTVEFEIHFDAGVPGLTFKGPDGQIYAIDRMTRFSDNQYFGIIKPDIPGSNSISPGSVCLEQRPDPNNPMIVECVRWGPK